MRDYGIEIWPNSEQNDRADYGDYYIVRAISGREALQIALEEHEFRSGGVDVTHVCMYANGDEGVEGNRIDLRK